MKNFNQEKFWRPLIIFYNYFSAIFIGPGFVQPGWKPVSKALVYDFSQSQLI
jgi:hypothetical protein